MFKNYKKILFAIVILGLFFSMTTALAQYPPTTPPVDSSGDIKDIIDGQLYGGGSLEDVGLPGEAKDPIQPVIDIIKWILGLLALIFLILIIAAGFRWMLSAGNTEQVDSAKKIIKAALIGVIIVFLSYAITVFVFNVVLSHRVW